MSRNVNALSHDLDVLFSRGRIVKLTLAKGEVVMGKVRRIYIDPEMKAHLLTLKRRGNRSNLAVEFEGREAPVLLDKVATVEAA